MKVQCENDEQRGRGHIRFVCTDVISPAAEFAFSVCRASDQTFLGRAGWQNAEEKHVPDACAPEDGATALYVGPSVVDSLDENENYRLTLFNDALAPQKGAFSIVNINRSLRPGQALVQGVVPESDPPEAAPLGADQAVQAPESEPQPEMEQTQEQELEEPVVMPAPAPVAGKFPVAPLVLLAILLLGGGIWWHMRQNAEAVPNGEKTAQQVEAAKNSDQTTPPAADAASGNNAEAPSAQNAGDKPASSAREQVRQFLRDLQASAQGAMALYRTLSQAPEGGEPETQDSVYRLLYFASQKGDADATLALARCVDPATPAFGTIPKDAREAWSHYAAVAGQRPEAADGMQRLKEWLGSEAGKGNAAARQWIDAIAKDNAKP